MKKNLFGLLQANWKDHRQAITAFAPPGNSLMARIGTGFLFGHFVLSTFAPVFVAAGLLLINGINVMAQTPGGGGIFGADATTAGTGLKEFLKWARGILFLVGIVFFSIAGITYYNEGSIKKPLVAGVLCWAYPVLAMISWAFSRGESVQVDTETGN